MARNKQFGQEIVILAKHLVLTHLYPPVERPTLRATIAAHYAGPITIAHDGAAFEIEED